MPPANSSRRGNPPLNTTLKRRPSVAFQLQSPVPLAPPDQPDGNIEGEDEDDTPGENMMDMLNILQEYQKKKSSKSSSRVAAIEAKKSAINDARRAEILQMNQEGTAYISQVKVKVQELRDQQVPPDAVFADIAALFANRSKAFDSQIDTLSHFLSQLSPVRIELIEENSADLRSHTANFEKTGKKIKKKAKIELQGGLEQQKLATEAQAYIKHYRHLVQN